MDGAHTFALFKAISGHSIYQPTLAEYERLGALQRELHTVTDELSRRKPETWAGYGRPVYNRETLIDISLRSLLNAPF